MRYVLFAALVLCGAAAAEQPLTIDLNNALERARTYSTQFLAAGIATSLAHEDTVQARAARLPTLSALNQYIYTQGNGTPSGVFVANDGVHIYNEQAVMHADLFSATRNAEYRRAIAAEAAARARAEIAGRGLFVTVVQSYYGLIVSERRAANAKASLDEAERFADITRKQEAGHAGLVFDHEDAHRRNNRRYQGNQGTDGTVHAAKNALGQFRLSQPIPVEPLTS